MAQVWPVGIDTIGSKIYFFFMAVNFICIPVSFDTAGLNVYLLASPDIPNQIIVLFYPETKGRPLEDMDMLFNEAIQGVNEYVDDHSEPVLPKNVSTPSHSWKYWDAYIEPIRKFQLWQSPRLFKEIWEYTIHNPAR